MIEMIRVDVLIAVIIFVPAIISIIYSLYAVICWILSNRDASMRKKLLIGGLGPFSLIFPRLMNEQSRKYFSRFVLGIGFFVLYVGVLFIFFG